ncbi:hypothetical protein R3W88_010924 [Solanum pinnatisectum]|uniref:Disease resistance R13L4/SHOC-2-like LRR domain-containing protein n=1 Tax=Solanum pinnatisectum TaxID=50273 RepID=A0AAV9L541_9SOLN|nr:hypothetical protein R3W88_010924 [Solanum pinnatisectum]
MVDKCGGLPLAIVALSGLLSHKRGLEEWQKVKDNLWQNIKDDSIEVSYILSLSYNDLSIALKQCFLYFGIFPEDCVVRVDHILWLWMAEGFIPTALEVNFLDIYDPRKHSISSFCLRHSIHSQGKRYLSLDLSNFKLRSLVFLDPDFLKMGLIKFRNMFQHLYVLYLEISVDNKSIVPDAIGSLYHLKFLRLRGIYDLPSSIGNLKNLQTLLVNDYGYSCQLPRETADLINLRHLVAPLKNLSTLRLLCKDDESFAALEFVNSCQKLHKLWLEGGIEKLPLSDQFPNSIVMMVLAHSKLTEDPMPILGMLPNLRNLEFFRAYEGKEITCSDNSFSQLEILRLDCLENLERWHLATSAMPHIKGFVIHRCPKLKEIPERMKDVERTPYR